jgi:hypothetical protein
VTPLSLTIAVPPNHKQPRNKTAERTNQRNREEKNVQFSQKDWRKVSCKPNQTTREDPCSPCHVAEEKVATYPARQSGKTSNGEVLLARAWSSLDGGTSGENCNPSETAKNSNHKILKNNQDI